MFVAWLCVAGGGQSGDGGWWTNKHLITLVWRVGRVLGVGGNSFIRTNISTTLTKRIQSTKMSSKMYSTANLSDVELKEQGNRLFSTRKYEDAINCYSKAIVSTKQT